MRGLMLIGAAVLAVLTAAPGAAAADDVLIDAGGTNTCLAASGVVHCWGEAFGPRPTRIDGIPASDGTLGTAITSLSVGDMQAACLVQGGTVRCWGGGAFALYANPEMTMTRAATVDGFGRARSVSVGTGVGPVCAVGDDRRVRCMGSDNRSGQLGIGSTDPATTPQVVPTIDDATAVGGGTFHGCAIHSRGKVSCWGANQWQQMGIPDPWDSRAYATPVSLPISDAIDLAVGIESTCVTRRSGAVACWGANSRPGLLGGPFEERFATVTGVGEASDITAGDAHHCAVVAARVSCWGRNDQGQVGNGETAFSGTGATEIDGLQGARAVTGGLLHTCAVARTDVWCWGWNRWGQLGDTSFTEDYSSRPRKVPFDDWNIPEVDGIIDTEGPFSQISTTRDLRCGRRGGEGALFGLLRSAFFENSSCGTWVKSDDVVFGPPTGEIDAPWKKAERRWVPVAQTESGSGTSGDPWEITTIVRGGDLEVTQTDRYVNGAKSTTTEVAIENRSADDAHDLVVYLGGDCKIGGGPLGSALEYGWQTREDVDSNAIGCSTGSYNGSSVTLDPDEQNRPQGFDSYAGDTPEAVARQIGRREMSNQAVTGVQMDAAALVASKATLSAGGTAGRRFKIRYDSIDIESAAPTPVPDPIDGGETPPVGLPWNMLAIGAPAAWAKGLSGAGQNVAIVDTGVEAHDPWIGELPAEACWTTKAAPLVEGNCPDAIRTTVSGENNPMNNSPQTMPQRIDGRQAGRVIARSAADPGGYRCHQEDLGPTMCEEEPGGQAFADIVYRGTAVAGIAAGRRAGAAVAPGAQVIAVNAASRFDPVPTRRDVDRGPRNVIGNPSDSASALAWIDSTRNRRRVAAVNLMLPGRHYRSDRSGYAPGTCAGIFPALERAVDALVRHRIPVVVAAGDDRDKRRLPWPACLPNVISVGSTDQNDRVAPSSNSSRQLTLLAPGVEVLGPTRKLRWSASFGILGINYAEGSLTGTYAAAAHVTGAIALYKQKNPRATPAEIRNRLRSTGIATTDTANNRKTPRLRVDRLLNAGLPSD